MLANFLIWVYGICLITGLGSISHRWVGKTLGLVEGKWQDILLLGMVVLTTLLAWLSIFWPINLSIHLPLALLSALSIIYHARAIKHSVLDWYQDVFSTKTALVGGGILVTLLLIQSSRVPWFADVGLYHAQTIQWIQSYPVVPGLGNLHGRLAFNSHFHLFAAFFSFGGDHHHAAVGLVVLIFMCFALRRIATSYGLDRLYKVAILLLPIIGYWKWYSSPAPDIAICYVTICVLVMIKDVTSLEAPPMAILLSLFALTIKPSVIILALGVGLIALTHLSRKKIVMWSVITLAVLAPWLIRNVYLSGYIVYPFASLDIFNFDFKIPQEIATADQQEIYLFARRPLDDWQQAEGQPLWQWLPMWLSVARKSDILLLTAVGLSVVLGSFGMDKWGWGYKSAFLISIGGSVFWFMMAPATRLGYGFLMPLASIGLYSLPVKKFFADIISRSILVIMPCFLFGLEVIREDPHEYVVFPENYSQRTLYHWEKPNGLDVKVADSLGRCWALPIPCTDQVETGLERRGKNLADGFRIRPAR